MFAHQRIPRRKFLRWTLSAFFFSALPWCSACSRTSSKNEQKLWEALAGTLFPGSPGIEQIGFYHHLKFVLSDNNYDPDIRRALTGGFRDFQGFVRKNVPDFTKLPLKKRHHWLKTYIRTNDDAENWLARVLTVIWEATLLDPHYGINKKMIGWKWLHHAYGHPRPDNSADYFDLLRKRRQSETIRTL